MRHIAFVSFCFILGILCLSFFQLCPYMRLRRILNNAAQYAGVDLVVIETQSHQRL